MSNRKFHLESIVIPENTSRLLYISSAQYGDDWTSHPHSHYFTEIFYIKNGTGHMIIENETLTLRPNSLVLIGSHVQHTEVSNPLDPLDYYVLGVEGLKINTDHPSEYSIIYSAPESSSIRKCFESILYEMNHKQEGYAQICQHHLAILILLICRKDHISYELLEPQSSSRECHKAKRYIETNYHEKITLDSLANICNLTKYYLSHKFKALYEKAPMAYLTEVRIDAAKDLLKTTNYSMEEIASATGFSSSSYFSQAFGKACGMSPQEYRKMQNVTNSTSH